MKLETLKSPKFEAMSTSTMGFVVGGDANTTQQAELFAGMCKSTSPGGSRTLPDGSTLKWSSDTVYTDGNGNLAGKTLHQ